MIFKDTKVLFFEVLTLRFYDRFKKKSTKLSILKIMPLQKRVLQRESDCVGYLPLFLVYGLK